MAQQLKYVNAPFETYICTRGRLCCVWYNRRRQYRTPTQEASTLPGLLSTSDGNSANAAAKSDCVYSASSSTCGRASCRREKLVPCLLFQ